MKVTGSIHSVVYLFLFNRECLFVNEVFLEFFINFFIRRKKKCVRYPEGSEMPGMGGNENLLGAHSPLALAHGMLQGSPLSPQFNQVKI